MFQRPLILLITVMFLGAAICPGFSSGNGREPSLPESTVEPVRMAPAPDDGSDNPRIILERILARKEFRDVKRPQPTIWEILQQKIAKFLTRLLGGFFASSVFSEISNVVIWILAGAAFVVLAVWIYGTLKQFSRRELANLSRDVPVSARPWPEWLMRAHEAAAAGDWRDAVRLAYWGGISFLESNGLWPPDRARTPREYLCMLPSSSEHGETLAALTRKFETVWYGGAEAGPESFSESLNCLERMGCHSS